MEQFGCFLGRLLAGVAAMWSSVETRVEVGDLEEHHGRQQARQRMLALWSSMQEAAAFSLPSIVSGRKQRPFIFFFESGWTCFYVGAFMEEAAGQNLLVAVYDVFF